MNIEPVDIALNQLKQEVEDYYNFLHSEFIDVLTSNHKILNHSELSSNNWKPQCYISSELFTLLTDALEKGVKERLNFIEAYKKAIPTTPREIQFHKDLEKFIPVFHFLQINGIENSIVSRCDILSVISQSEIPSVISDKIM